jgi:hypothetical protein
MFTEMTGRAMERPANQVRHGASYIKEVRQMAEDPKPVNPPVTNTADRLVGNETVAQSIDDIAISMAKRGKEEHRRNEEGNSLFATDWGGVCSRR